MRPVGKAPLMAAASSAARVFIERSGHRCRGPGGKGGGTTHSVGRSHQLQAPPPPSAHKQKVRTNHETVGGRLMAFGGE